MLCVSAEFLRTVSVLQPTCFAPKGMCAQPQPHAPPAFSPDRQALHSRMEPLLYFFVDGASAIDPEDPDWHLLTAVEQTEEGTEVLGFATCCEY